MSEAVAAGEGTGGNGNGHGTGHGNGTRPLVAVGPGQARGGCRRLPASRLRQSSRSYHRGGAERLQAATSQLRLPTIAPAEPVSTYPETPGVAQGPDQDDEPPVPDEARARIVADASADTPVEAGPDAVLHVRFAGGAASDRVVAAMQAFKAVLRDRPGATRVVIHVPAQGDGSPLPMELSRGVAYDAELLAEVRRRLGDGLIDLRLA